MVSKGPGRRLHTRDLPHPSIKISLALTSLFYAGKHETDLTRRVRRDGGEGIIHGAKHFRACAQDGGDERQVQPQTLALRCDNTQGRQRPLHILDPYERKTGGKMRRRAQTYVKFE